MQVKKARVSIRRLSEEELSIVSRFFESIGLSADIFPGESLVALDIEGGGYSDIFYLPSPIRGLIGRLGLKALYSAGLHIGSLYRGLKPRLSPSLHLARELGYLCIGRAVRCSIISEKGETHFLYGKNVYRDNIIEASEGLSIVINASGEPLGWAQVSKDSLKPIRDLGWYLRRGG